jgi:pimeloyl-ACP methyl ester carboxylesterase
MQHLIILHGAIGHKGQFEQLAAQLSDTFTVHTLNFSGHGGEAFPDGDFSISRFADEVNAYMEKNGIDKAAFFGYSMGGYVALYHAKQYPHKVSAIVTLATKFHWDEPTAAKECQMLDADKIETKVPAFATTLRETHAPNDWKEVLNRTKIMLQGLGAENALKPEDYTTINTPVRLLLGDRDKMVSLEETVAVYKSLPNAQMAMLPGTPHPIEQVSLAFLPFLIKSFVSQYE